MAKRNKNGSQEANPRRADESNEVAAQDEKHHQLTGHDHSPQQPEHCQATAASFGHDETACLAHELWKARGCPSGSPDEDWFCAVKQLLSSDDGH